MHTHLHVGGSIAVLVHIPGGATSLPNFVLAPHNRACGHAACVGVIAYFLRGDLAARDKQIARISREESLAGLRLQLASGKTLPLGRLRSFCRPVMFYGSAEQVAAALEAAAPFKDELLRRGVFIVPLPLRGGDASDGLPALDKDDKESARCAGLGTAPCSPRPLRRHLT